MLIGHYIYGERDYDRLSPLFENGTLRRDEGSGRYVHLIPIGDPAQSGTGHEDLRSVELQARDEAEAAQYAEEVYKTGRARNFQLKQMEKVRQALEVPRGRLPCIAFRFGADIRCIGTLQIQEPWFETNTPFHVFDIKLQEWCRSSETLQLLLDCRADPSNLSKIQDELDGLSANINAALGEGGVKRSDQNEMYCLAVTSTGRQLVDYGRYDRFQSQRSEYDFFFDAITGEVVAMGSIKYLSDSECRILADFVRADRLLAPSETPTGKGALSTDAARKLFTAARRKVDTETRRQIYEMFPSRRGADCLRYRFVAPLQRHFCILISAETN